MSRRIDLEPHLSIDELENRYGQSKDAIANQSFDLFFHVDISRNNTA